MKLLDCTLRDGGYYTNWSFDDDFVKRFIKSTSHRLKAVNTENVMIHL